MKKEHMLLAGAGVLGLIYLLSRGNGGAPMMLGGGGGSDPGLETITSKTITIPAGGEEVGGSILLPPPDPGRFFDAPSWVKPDGDDRTRPPTKKEVMMRGETAAEPKHVAYRAALGVSEEPPLTIGGYIAPGGVYDPYVAPGGIYDPYVAPGWGKKVAPSKKALLVEGAKMGISGSIPGQLVSKIWSWF